MTNSQIVKAHWSPYCTLNNNNKNKSQHYWPKITEVWHSTNKLKIILRKEKKRKLAQSAVRHSASSMLQNTTHLH